MPRHNDSRARPRRVHALNALIAAASTAAGLFLAVHYPLSAATGIAVFGAVAVGTWAKPTLWLLVLPALVPVIGLAPWTGWIAFEEIDVVVLAIAAGGHARLAIGEREAHPATSPLAWLALLAFATSLVVSGLRGALDAGALRIDWYQGYREPLNSLRLAKPFFAALLLWPLWRTANVASPLVARSLLSLGLSLGLAGAAVAAIWERVAFPGLLDFSSDYRTTALFWEMHVGGAAFDGFLALTVPFALRELQAASRARFLAGCLLALVTAYACLTTFSRGVYLAIPAGAAIAFWLAARQRRSAAPTQQRSGPRAWPALGLLAAFTACAFWLFPTSGYRGLIAVLGAFAILVRLVARDESVAPGTWPLAAGAGALAAAGALGAADWLPKGAYIAYAVIWTAAIAVSSSGAARPWWLMGGFLGVLAAFAIVVQHWGGSTALAQALPIVVVLAAAGLAAAASARARVVLSVRGQGALFSAFAIVAAAVGVAGGGAYMGGRFETTESDLQGRIAHWREGVRMLVTPIDWAFGRGLGRFPALYALEHVGVDAPGDYRSVRDGDKPYLVLTGGRHVIGWGELLRVSQRIALPVSPLVVRFRARGEQATELHFEVCEKHLLYNASCDVKEISVAATGGHWSSAQTQLAGGGLGRGAWYAPRLIAFSVGNARPGTRVELTDVSLQGPDGRELLRNGDFSEGLAFWFPTSDRNHMPWHLKNVLVHVLFHQGMIGLVLWTTLVCGALWRASFGQARADPISPAIAGALLAFLIVGLFDSLLDVPRIAFVFYLLVLIGLTRQRHPNRH